MRFPLRRLLLGFAAGAAAGWAAGLLRTPREAPEGTGADAAADMPQEEFGEPAVGPVVEHPPPKKAQAPSITPPPGPGEHAGGSGESEPAKPARTRTRAATPNPVATATEELRAGREQATEHLADVPPPKKRAPRKRPAPPVPPPAEA